ncbi:hypothetical protein ACJRO7_004142 [Eucalyptus globulus]|uniref:Uncharacterized protein n=1 Tax=Eucalyptus globulus TaxID=34317 RepID=A0ABD3IWE6_EUCGL
MGWDTIADIITFIRNADMNRKWTIQIASTNITENIVRIFLRECFIKKCEETSRKQQIFFGFRTIERTKKFVYAHVYCTYNMAHVKYLYYPDFP